MSRPTVVTYIATATPDPSIAALPWPAPSELTPIPEAQPITAVRTGVDPRKAKSVVAQKKRTTPSLSSSLVSVDMLSDFLQKYSLGLRMRPRIEAMHIFFVLSIAPSPPSPVEKECCGEGWAASMTS